MQISINGGNVTLLASGVYPSSFIADATNLYFVDDDVRTIYGIPLNGGAITKFANTKYAFDRTSLAQDKNYLYWVNQLYLAGC